MRRHRAVFEQHVIGIVFDHGRDQMIDEAGIDEGRIGIDTHDDVGIEEIGGARKPRQHIVLGPAHHRHAMFAAEFDDGVVERIGRGRNRDALDELRALETMHDVPQQRLAGDRLQHLSGQAGRAHAGLDHGDNAQMIGRFGRKEGHAALSHACRT